MNLGDLLNTLATKCGLQNNQDLIDILSNSELSQHEVSSDLVSQFDKGLMSLDGAKNNPEVLNHFKPIILKAADDKFAILASKYGIDAEVAGEKSTYKKIDILENKLAAKIAEAEAKAAQAGGNKTEEVNKLNGQIVELQHQLQTLTASKERELEEFKSTTAKQQLDMLVNFELNGKRYANAELGDTNVTIARALIDKALKEQKAVIVNDGGAIKLKQAENTQLDYLDSSFKPVSFSDFTNRLLAEKHLLEVSNDDENNGGGHFTTHITVPTGNGDIDTSRMDAATAASLADLD